MAPRERPKASTEKRCECLDMIGQTLDHYRIESKLGEGGMGVVYEARDTHLNRRVAIKVLRTDRIADPSRKQRFVQEAMAASALNHPNVIFNRLAIRSARQCLQPGLILVQSVTGFPVSSVHSIFVLLYFDYQDYPARRFAGTLPILIEKLFYTPEV